jgi:hypothetical protein
MAYKRRSADLGMSVKQAQAISGVSETAIFNRLVKGWTRRQVLGLDPPPGVTSNTYWQDIMDACARADRRARSERESLMDRARGGDEAAAMELKEVYHLLRWEHAGREVVR